MNLTAQLLDMVQRRLGIAQVPRDQELRDLDGFVRARATVLGVSGEDYLSHLANLADEAPEFQRLVQLVVNGHTSFFRHAPTFDALRVLLAALGRARSVSTRPSSPCGPLLHVAGRTVPASLTRGAGSKPQPLRGPFSRSLLEEAPSQPVRVWSACCASGEEPWTVALVAAEAGVSVEVIGTDINAHSIMYAKTGVYSDRALAKVPSALRRRYFEQHQGKLRVGPRLRRSVHFILHNVLDPPPGRFDIVLCQNTLIYFQVSEYERVVHNLIRAIGARGTLVLGPAESLVGLDVPVEAVSLSDVRLGWRLRGGVGRSPTTADVLELPSGSRAPRATKVPSPATARSLWSQGDLNGAREQLGQWLSAHANDLDAWLLSGHLHLAAHDFAIANMAYQRVTTADALRVEARLGQALLCRKSGDLDGALVALRQIGFLQPQHWMAQYLLFGVYRRLGRQESAREAARVALRSIEAGIRLSIDPVLARLLPTREQVLSECLRQRS